MPVLNTTDTVPRQDTVNQTVTQNTTTSVPIDTNVDQLTDKSILTGAGSDLVVCRFASEINTGSGDDQVAVFTNKSNVILGKGNDIVAYSTYQNGSTLDGEDGFDIAIFMNRAEYLQSLANIVIKNIECIKLMYLDLNFHFNNYNKFFSISIFRILLIFCYKFSYYYKFYSIYFNSKNSILTLLPLL
jgi:hypothetical protein